MRTPQNVVTLLLILFSLSSCSTIHTGPLIGDIPLPFNRCQEGDIYADPGKRFEVACPSPNAAINAKDIGVSFSLLDISFNSVLVYNIQADPDEIFKNYKNLLSEKRGVVEVVTNQEQTYRGYPSQAINFVIREKNSSSGGIVISRFIKTSNYLYWVQYSCSIITEIRPHDLEAAEKFFSSIRFKG